MGATGLAQVGVTADTIVFGMEGTTNSFSLDEENLGFRLAFEERNAQGAIHGRKIAWQGYGRSSAADIEAAVVNARKLVDEDRVFALINFGGPEVIPTSQLAGEKRVPLLFPHSALISSDGRRYVFTSYPSYEGEARAMLRYLVDDRGLTRIAIVHDVNVYGALFLRLLQQHAPEFGYTFAGNAGVATRNPADLTNELRGLVERGADAVMMALYPAQAKSLMATKSKLGWTGRMVSVGPLTDEQYLNTPGGAAEGTIGFCYYPDPDSSAEPGMAAYRATMAKFHPGRPLNR
jgi:branched-chain amino acid transport system substrate-binding protein